MADIKVLYIDDDPSNRSLVRQLLSIHGFHVTEADTGLKGLAIARQEPPDLILMDINMPGLDGHETTTRMRSLSELKKTPIIALTATKDEGARQLALAAGCDGYIQKPIDIDKFPGQLLTYLEGYKDTITTDERQHYLDKYNQKLVEHLESKILELQEANARLRKTDKIKSDFITLAAHELRTPISLVYGYANLLQSVAQQFLVENSAINRIGELSSKIYNAVHRLNDVVNDIINIALIESKEIHFTRQPVRLSEIIQAALTELNPAKNGRLLGIHLAESINTLPLILGDKKMLQQAFWNILSNAIKFTPDGGMISVEGEVSSGNEVLISIKDTGIGVNSSDRQAIFEQFYTVGNVAYHSSSKTAFGGGGMGLGLPIALGIIKGHGGQLWVEDTPEGESNSIDKQGSTFYVLLPIK